MGLAANEEMGAMNASERAAQDRAADMERGGVSPCGYQYVPCACGAFLLTDGVPKWKSDTRHATDSCIQGRIWRAPRSERAS